MAAESGAAPAAELLMMPASTALRLVLFALAAGVLFGVDLGSIGGAVNAMRAELGLTTIQVEFVISSTKGGAIFGCLAGGAMMQRWGRRNTVAFSLVPFLVGPVLLGFASSFGVALIGRVLMGVAIGIASVAAPCFLSEVAPAGVRGAVVALYEVAIALGFFATSVIAWAMEAATDDGSVWRLQAGGVPFVCCLPLVLAVSLVPESPRWLLSNAGGDADRLKGALVAMADLGCKGSRARLDSVNSQADTELSQDSRDGHAPSPDDGVDEMLQLWDRQHSEQGCPLTRSPRSAQAREPDLAAAAPRVSFWGILGETLSDIAAVAAARERVPRGTRKGFLLACLAAILTQACASTAVLVYAQVLLKHIGVERPEDQDAMAIGVAAAKLLGVGVSLLIVNKVGRRQLLGWGGLLSAGALAMLSAGTAASSAGVVVPAMCIFIIFYCSTWASGYWVVATELTAVGGPKLAASCQAASTAVLFVAGWLTGLTFATLVEAGGPWALLVYAGVGLLMAAYGWAIPEMRGKTLEECGSALTQAPGGGPKKAEEAAAEAAAPRAGDVVLEI